MWGGVCQALEWFFGLFGYKRDGKAAKCIWGVFATGAAIIVAITAASLIYEKGSRLYNKVKTEDNSCKDPDCEYIGCIRGDIYFHNHYDGEGYIFNRRTGEKFVKQVDWISEPEGSDSLVCFSDGKKRGYFNRNTGKVVIEPKYDHAWIFSEGLAGVDDGGAIKFIDGTGKVVIDNGITYNPSINGYLFHGGYCLVITDDWDKYGLIDKTGKFVLPIVYDYIGPTDEYEFWQVRKGKESAVLNKDMKTVIPLQECDIHIGDDTIDLTMPDHTLRKYDLQGTLLGDFYICSVRMLEYSKEEIVYGKKTADEEEDYESDDSDNYYHPKATARLRAYTAGDGYEGLMTADGHIVTMPLYKEIEAIGYDLYLCEISYYDRVIVNGKGETVKWP